MSNKQHPSLFIPGPTNVSPAVLEAQTEAMIGHRTAEFETLFAEVQDMLKQVFFTEGRVYVLASSGTGLWEAAIRNGIHNRVLNFVNGAFSDRWHQVAVGCGKDASRVDVEWGKAITPEVVDEALQQYPDVEAIALAHNETSTGVASPLGQIAAMMREKYPDVLIMVDAVSSLSGVKLPFDEWGLDMMLTSTQKALAVPPGLALGAVSDRLLEKAKSVQGRGYYFDFLVLDKYLKKNTTPATPNISLMRALRVQLNHMMEEGLEARFARHQALAERTRRWVAECGFEMFSEEGYHSPTVSNVRNTRSIDIGDLNSFLKARGMVVSNGYGKLKGEAFRIAHMGNVTADEMETLLTAMTEYLEDKA